MIDSLGATYPLIRDLPPSHQIRYKWEKVKDFCSNQTINQTLIVIFHVMIEMQTLVSNLASRFADLYHMVTLCGWGRVLLLDLKNVGDEMGMDGVHVTADLEHKQVLECVACVRGTFQFKRRVLS